MFNFYPGLPHVCIHVTKCGKNYLDQANDKESEGNCRSKIQDHTLTRWKSKHKLTLAQGPGIHTA